MRHLVLPVAVLTRSACAVVLHVRDSSQRSESEEFQSLTTAEVLQQVQELRGVFEVQHSESVSHGVESKLSSDDARTSFRDGLQNLESAVSAHVGKLSDAIDLDKQHRMTAEHVEFQQDMVHEVMHMPGLKQSLLHVFDNTVNTFAHDAAAGELRNIALEMQENVKTDVPASIFLPKVLSHAPRLFSRMISLLAHEHASQYPPYSATPMAYPQYANQYAMPHAMHHAMPPSREESLELPSTAAPFDEDYMDIPAQEEPPLTFSDDETTGVPEEPAEPEDDDTEPGDPIWAISPYWRFQICFPMSISVMHCDANFGACVQIHMVVCTIRMISIIEKKADDESKAKRAKSKYDLSTIEASPLKDFWEQSKHPRFMFIAVGVDLTVERMMLQPAIIMPVCSHKTLRSNNSKVLKSPADIFVRQIKTGAKLLVLWGGVMNADEMNATGFQLQMVLMTGFGVEPFEVGKAGLILESMFFFQLRLAGGPVEVHRYGQDACTVMYSDDQLPEQSWDDHASIVCIQPIANKLKSDGWHLTTAPMDVLVQHMMSFSPDKRMFDKLTGALSISCWSKMMKKMSPADEPDEPDEANEA